MRTGRGGALLSCTLSVCVIFASLLAGAIGEVEARVEAEEDPAAKAEGKAEAEAEAKTEAKAATAEAGKERESTAGEPDSVNGKGKGVGQAAAGDGTPAVRETAVASQAPVAGETAVAGQAPVVTVHAESAETASVTRVARAHRRPAGAGGLEEGLPEDGRYARGLLLDEAGRHVEALHEYTLALDEARSWAERKGAPRERYLAWRAKIAWQREMSEEVLEQEAYVAVMPGSALAHLALGRALHAKYVSIRAFTGRRADGLWERARFEYVRAAALDAANAVPRLLLAKLYADAGRQDEARREYVQLGARRDDDDLALHGAGYYAAIGELDASLARLARAVRRPEARRWALCSNDFDRLRADPARAARFAALVGDPFRGKAD